MATDSIRASLLDRLLHTANTLSRWAIWVAGALTLIMALYIVADIFIRKFTAYSLGSDELSGYAFAISISWALAFATLQRANIRIDALYQVLPVRLCAILDWIALVGLAVFIAYLTRYAVNVAHTSWTRDATANTVLATPLWIPQYIWAAGLIWLCIVLALMLLRASTALVRGDMAGIRTVCGMRTAQEEAREEAEAGARMARGEAS
ncbi:TRAP transporter small permease [Allopusillimonas soli]|uniref:TRAP transporter small permease protein n=1 Tax=Allopusillimonas soli TaxID=659016 RepID=A0A853FC35_9BURK|nr:TRAP transporter small permease [Allopusillimonas soli]NYT37507.1 TRAP transporter small permease [Allopusillimonas soli]TEA74518.1 TRAP transporter small permease [Allopusillimonas soli]